MPTSPPEPQPTGWRELAHTADLELELWAPREEELLAVGAQAIVSLVTEGASIPAAIAAQEREVALDSLDPQDRLVRWLNEVLFLAVTEGFLTVGADIELLGGGLRATLRGAAGQRAMLRHELKGVTYHDLALEVGPAGARARVVVDV